MCVSSRAPHVQCYDAVAIITPPEESTHPSLIGTPLAARIDMYLADVRLPAERTHTATPDATVDFGSGAKKSRSDAAWSLEIRVRRMDPEACATRYGARIHRVMTLGYMHVRRGMYFVFDINVY